jgi:hypothetical protein
MAASLNERCRKMAILRLAGVRHRHVFEWSRFSLFAAIYVSFKLEVKALVRPG